MTIGIYALVFKGTDKVYIGQSIHIEVRFKEHVSSIYNGHISNKLAKAIKMYGEPSLEILEQCSISELDTLEEVYIKEFDSVNNGFNILHRPFSSFQGDKHPNSTISNAEISNLLLTIISNPSKRLTELSAELNIPLAIIQNITSLKSHTWLKEEYPKEYDILESLKGTRQKNSRARKNYPTILSPDNTEFKVENAKEFALVHNLNHSHLVGVLNGKRITHKGWKLKENIL